MRIKTPEDIKYLQAYFNFCKVLDIPSITSFDWIRQTIDLLPGREKAVIIERFGLDNGQPQSLDKVGQHYGLTRQRINQIERRALTRLKGFLK